MLHKIIDHLIKTFGREVLEQWIPLDRLSITSIADPELKLTNIPLPEKLFDSPSIPFLPVKSNIGSVTVRCPWKAFLNNDANLPLSVEIHNVEAVIRFKRITEWNPEHVKNTLLSTRDELLRKWNSLTSSLSYLSGKKTTHGSKAVHLINSLDITFHNVKVVLLDNLLYKEPFSITIETKHVRCSGMKPDEPSLNDEERQGVAMSFLSALWFRSTEVHAWHSIYYSEADEPGGCMPDENTKQHPSKGRAARRRRTYGKDGDETAASDCSHSSDELFGNVNDIDATQQVYPAQDSGLWNLCMGGCSNPTEHPWTEFLAAEVSSADESLTHILKGPYKSCNITPPRGIRFDLVFKNWNLMAFAGLDNMPKQQKKTVQLTFTAAGEEAEVSDVYAPCFDGSGRFEPYDLTLTSAGAEVLYNIIKYLQLASSYRELSSGCINSTPDVADCERYIKIISSSQWTHKEENDVKFVQNFERNVPFHILLKLRNIVKASQKGRVAARTCFLIADCCSQNDSGDTENEFVEAGSTRHYEWFEGESCIRIIFAHLNLCVVPLTRCRENGIVPATMIQVGMFAFQGKSLGKRSTYKVLACKPNIRMGDVHVDVRRRTFSAKVFLLPDCGSESLLCYPEMMFTQPYEFFKDYGADDLERCLKENEYSGNTTLRIIIERYIDNIKHLHIMVPKIVVLFNVLAKLDTLLDEAFWTMDFITIEQFVERSRKKGYSNESFAAALMSHIQKVSSRTICRMDMYGIMARALFKSGLQFKYSPGLDIGGLDNSTQKQPQQSVLDWFLENDRELNTWKYCEDIQDPFSFKHMITRKCDDPGAGKIDRVPNTVYCRENFVAELDSKPMRNNPVFVLVPGSESRFTMNSKVLSYMNTLRRWYNNTRAIELPQIFTTGLANMYSLTLSVRNLVLTRDSGDDFTYCLLEDVNLSSLDVDESVTDLASIGSIHILKRLNAVCIEVLKAEALLGNNLRIFVLVVEHIMNIYKYVNYVDRFICALKVLTNMEMQEVNYFVSVSGNSDVCRMLRQEFYESSPHAEKDCSSDFLNALEGKVNAIASDKKVVFISAGSAKINMTSENALYEISLYKTQVEVQGKERVMACLGNMSVCVIENDMSKIILCSKPMNLGSQGTAIHDIVENGQIALDYKNNKSRYINVEVRNVHHVLDMQFCKRIVEIVKQFKLPLSQVKSEKENKISCNVMLHHSSCHYAGIGAVIDLYAVVNVVYGGATKCISLKIPRYHATFTKSLTTRVFAVSLLDTNFELKCFSRTDNSIAYDTTAGKTLSTDQMVLKATLDLSHFVIWGIHNVPSGTELKNEFEDVNEAAMNLEMLLHETWFNHMTIATLPSLYDDTPMVLVPLFATQYSKAARLTPMLNHAWITDWLISASRSVLPHLCDGAAANIMKILSKESVHQRNHSMIKAAASIVFCDDAIVAMGELNLSSLGAFLHCESIMQIVDLFSQCKTLMGRSVASKEKKRKKKVNILKINITMDSIDVTCASDVEINNHNTMCSSLLPTTIADTPLPRKRPMSGTSAFHILCMYRFPRVMLVSDALCSIILQTGATLRTVNELYNRMDEMEELREHFLFDHTEVLQDSKYQATLHFFDNNYKEGRGRIISLKCDTLNTVVFTTKDRYEFWNDVVRKTVPDETMHSPTFVEEFKKVLKLEMTDGTMDLCVASSSLYATKLTISKMNIIDAWDRSLLENLYDTRCAMGNLGSLDEAGFPSTGDQVGINVSVVDDVLNIKVSLEHSRSEIQINGVNLILGIIQDLKLLSLLFSGKKKSKERKKLMRIEVILNLHELWLYPSLWDNENTDLSHCPVTSIGEGKDKCASVGYSENTIPQVLKTAKEVKYKLLHSSAHVLSGATNELLLCSDNVIGCLISLSISSSKKGNSKVGLKYMGVALGMPKIVDGVKMLMDERNDYIFNNIEMDERMLFEVRESVLKSKVVDNDHVVIAFNASKPKLSVNVDQLFQLLLLKKTVIESAIAVLKVHRAIVKGKRDHASDVAESLPIGYDLIDEIKLVAAKYNLPMVDLSNVHGSIYNVPAEVLEKNRLSLEHRERESMLFNKAIRFIDKLIWKDGSRQLSLSLSLNDCKCVLFSLKTELVLNVNLQQMSFDLTYTSPTFKRRTIVDSTIIFNVTTYYSNLNYHDTVLKTTVVSTQVAYEGLACEMPSLDINIHVSGLAVEVNACLMQLINQLKHVSSMVSSESVDRKAKYERALKLYNELDLDVSLIGSQTGRKAIVDVMQLPSQRYTQISDKELYICVKDATANWSGHNALQMVTGQFEAVSAAATSINSKSDWVMREGKNLLFGNSNNVKSLLNMLNGQGGNSSNEFNIEEIFKSDRSLLLIGKYQTEQTGARLFSVPNSRGLILIEQFMSEDDSPYAIMSSSIRIQNATDIPLGIRIDHKLGYFTKVAYRLTQHPKPKDRLKDMSLEPYTSSCVPLSWFGTGMMPVIGPKIDDDSDLTLSDKVPFQFLHSLLNMNRLTVSEFERSQDFVLRFRGFLSLKCSVLAREAAGGEDCGSCFYHFVIKIEPMVKLVNILPCDIHVALSLNRVKLVDDLRMETNNTSAKISNYKVQTRLKTGDELGIPFSEQKLFMRISVYGTQLEGSNSDSMSSADDFEYVSPVFQIYLPTVGTASIVKMLKIYKGSVNALLHYTHDKQQRDLKEFEDHLKSMCVSIDLSRHDIRIWWPFIFENMSNNPLLINGFLLEPMGRFFGNLHDASNCRIRAVIYNDSSIEEGKQVMHSMSQCVKLDLTSTTDFRPPINLVIPLQKRCMTQVSISESGMKVEGVLESIVNNNNVKHARRYIGHELINEDYKSFENDTNNDDKSSDVDVVSNNNAFLCLGSTVRYAKYPYNMCKIVSVTNLYTFVNNLPFTICVRGNPEEHERRDIDVCKISSDVIIKPGETGALHSPFQGAYIIKVENDICSGIFSLQYPSLPYVFQLELNSNNVTYSTVATRGLLIQVNVISGFFEGSKMPYSYNGYYFVLSFPHKPQYQILNLTKYTLSYTVPENMNTIESKLVDSYESREPAWIRTPLNKIGILPPTCITHYVPSALSKSQHILQICLKVLNVDSCEWHIEQVNFVREGYHVINFVKNGENMVLYATLIIRSNGTRIITIVDSKPAAIELNRIENSCSMVQRLQWSNINLSFLTPRITVTLSIKRKVILALHLTNSSFGISITPSKSTYFEREDKDVSSLEPRCNMVEFDGVVQSIHIDHFVQGYIPVILKSSAKPTSLQESFLHMRVASSNFMALGLPVYDLIQIKLSPLSINIEICVIEQLIESIESMVKSPIGNVKTDVEPLERNTEIVIPQPKWVEMEPAPPVYIRKLTVEPINLILSIRTSSLQLAHQTMRLLDALPLDTPCVCVHFAREERGYMIVGWKELMHSLKNSYLRQLIRQSLPSAWLSNSFAFLYGILKGLALLAIQPAKNTIKFRNPLEGFTIGICNGIMFLALYIAGGAAQSIGHVLNIFHKIMGGHKSKPQGVIDAMWLGLNVFLLHVFYRPWKKLFNDFSNSQSRGDGILKTSVGVVLNMGRCAISPVIGVVNMLITIVEGFSNVLLGDIEQFTHVYERDQLEKVMPTTYNVTERVQEKSEVGNTQASFVRRMKTSIALRKRAN